MYAALGVRVLEDDAPDVAGDVQLVEVHHLHRDAERYGPGLHTGDGLRVQLVRQHEPLDIKKLSLGEKGNTLTKHSSEIGQQLPNKIAITFYNFRIKL